MSAAQPSSSSRHRPPPWRDVRVLRIVGQTLFLIAVAGFFYLLYSNFRVNYANVGLPTGFGYLDNPALFQLADTPFDINRPVRDAVLEAVVNTLQVSIAGIIAATVLGVIVGIARLSSNWLVRKAAALYVEALRNIPVLIVIFFFFFAVVAAVLPPIQEAWVVPGVAILSNRAVWVPWLTTGGAGLGGFGIVLAVTAVAAAVVVRWRTRVHERTGAPHHRVVWGLGVALAMIAVGYVATGMPLTVTTPERTAFGATGGIALAASYTALFLALSLYTGSHIAEIVRGSILAVPKGQTEASAALALTPGQRMRHVILPQALRILVPPTANQYLNLTKNSSLGIAIGYAELTQVTRVIIGNGNPAVQSIFILMAWYLLFSLTISVLTNLVNRRLTLVEI